MVTSSAVVGSSAISSSGSQASAIAIMTRCFMPPESWNGYSCRAARGIGNAHRIEQLQHPRLQRRPRQARCGARSASAICSPAVITGFSDSAGSWKIIADAPPAHVAHAGLGQLQQVAAVELDAAADDAAGVRQQAHDRQRGHGFAAAGLAHQREGLAAANVEGHAVHGADDARRCPAVLSPDA